MRIPMSHGFPVLPEGPTILKITDASFDQKFGQATVKFVNAQGDTHQERYQLIDMKTEQPNQGAMYAFTILAESALNNFEMNDVDPAELVDHYIAGDIEHSESNGRTYAHIRNMAPADGFEGEAPAEAPAAPTGGFNLADLLAR